MTAPAGPTGSHEFSRDDGRAFAALGAAASRGGALLYALAALLVIVSFETLAAMRARGPSASILGVLAGAGLTVAVIAAVVARWMRRAARHGAGLASTAGDDVGHALRAMREIGAVMSMLRGAVVAVAALALVALVARVTRM